MKITKQKLVKIIKEELEAALEEGEASSANDPVVKTDAYNKGFLDANFEIDEKGASQALDDARGTVGDDDVEMRKEAVRLLKLLKPSKGGLGPQHYDDEGLPF